MLSRSEVAASKNKLDGLVARRAAPFKIGRVAQCYLRGLPRTLRYAGYVDKPHVLFSGSASQVKKLECILIEHGWAKFGRRQCLNRQLGGGHVSRRRNHVVYVFFFGSHAALRRLSKKEDAGPLWAGLKKAWVGFRIALANEDAAGAHDYAGAINLFQRLLGEEETAFKF